MQTVSGVSEWWFRSCNTNKKEWSRGGKHGHGDEEVCDHALHGLTLPPIKRQSLATRNFRPLNSTQLAYSVGGVSCISGRLGRIATLACLLGLDLNTEDRLTQNPSLKTPKPILSLLLEPNSLLHSPPSPGHVLNPFLVVSCKVPEGQVVLT